MTLRQKISLIATYALILTVSSVSFWNHVSADSSTSDLDYAIIARPNFMSFSPEESRWVEIQIQNVGTDTWDREKIALHTKYPTGQWNRPSIWKGEGWEDNTLIRPQSDGNILPGQKMSFVFELKAPKYSGFYREHFQLSVGSFGAFKGDPIYLNMQVGAPVLAQDTPDKEIQIYRETQQSNMLENGFIVATLTISSGKPGYTTPAGNYKIMNHAKEAYSARYKLYMSNWMALTNDTTGYQGYGLHSLAYWKTSRPLYPNGTIVNGRLYEGNRVYEDAVHLGKPMSHGCIRYDVDESAIIYEWATDGTRVRVI